jgi:hypothetical protein
VEAIVPLNSEAGRSLGARAQLLLFLQDLIPAVFGKPLLSEQITAWIVFPALQQFQLPALS